MIVVESKLTVESILSIGAPEDISKGKIIKIHKFPKDHKVKLFRVSISTNSTDDVITNEMAQKSLNAVGEEYGFRWKIEKFHREVKQVSGIEKCQCRRGRIQRNYTFFANE